MSAVQVVTVTAMPTSQNGHPDLPSIVPDYGSYGVPTSRALKSVYTIPTHTAPASCYRRGCRCCDAYTIEDNGVRTPFAGPEVDSGQTQRGTGTLLKHNPGYATPRPGRPRAEWHDCGKRDPSGWP